MEESYHHHHRRHYHHDHHGHETAQDGTNSNVNVSAQQQNVTQSAGVPVLVPRPNEQASSGGGGVQATSSFHSVSSLDSSAEMAKYFPDAQTPNLSPFRHNQEAESQAASTSQGGPYTAVSGSTPGVAKAPVIVPPPNQPRTNPQVPSGIPAYPSQIEGISVSQVVVNDVIVDLQTKVINETQQQYHDDASSGVDLEGIAPIYIRAPNPTIILRSDLHRLRAELTTRPPVVARHIGGSNSFQGPSFPPPQQYHSSESHAEYRNTTYAQ